MARYLEKFQSKMRYTTKQKNLRQSCDYQRFYQVIRPGLEPGTPTLKVLCSTD